MLSIRVSLVLATVLLFLSGCAGKPQRAIPLAPDFYSQEQKTVGLYIPKVKADTHLWGASCLLCYAAAAAANSSLTTHMEKVDVTDLLNIRDAIIQAVEAKNMKVTIIDTPIKVEQLKKFSRKDDSFAPKDFSTLKEKLNVDKLIVVNYNEVGAYRSYSGYIPTSDPMGYVTGDVYLVDLTTNQYDLYARFDHKVAVQGEWDEPPKFPGVTNSYYEAVEKAKAQIISNFK